MTVKSRMRSAVRQQNIPSQSPNAMVNRAGGVAFEIKDPALKLITMTASSFFEEDQFYKNTSGLVQSSKGGMSKWQRLEMRLKTAQDKITFLEAGCISDTTQEIFAAASDIAKQNPEDLLIIARWLRKEMNMRTTPQALLTVASQFDSTKPFVRRYTPEIVVRPDEVKTVVLMHRFLFGTKTIKNCLGQGLSDAMSKFGEAALLKYNNDAWPAWKDVLKVLPRGKGRPIRKELAQYFLTGEVTNPEATPVIASRKRMAKMTEFDAAAKKLAKDSRVNWEVLVSQFGKQEGTKKKVWEFLVEENLLGYMALMRNLRNLLESGVDAKVIEKACAKLSDPKEVMRSKQFPFRFLMAHRVLNEHFSYGRTASMQVSSMLEAVEEAANLSVENVPVLPGLTAVFADNSGSMNIPISAKSQMTCAGAANALCGIIAKRSEKAVVCAFGETVAPVTFTKHNTVIEIAERVQNAPCGWSTNGHKIPLWLEAQGLKPDRVIVLSDMQAYVQSFSGRPLCDTWSQFSRRNKSPWLHTVHLNGYGDSPVDEGSRVNQIAGFSEKILGMMLQTEGVLEGNSNSVPTLDQVRKSWKL